MENGPDLTAVRDALGPINQGSNSDLHLARQAYQRAGLQASLAGGLRP